MLPQKILKFQSANKWFLAFRGLDWVQKRMFSIQENLHGSNLAKTSSQILIYQPHNQLLQAMKNDNYQVTYICTWTNSIFVNTLFKLVASSLGKKSGRFLWPKAIWCYLAYSLVVGQIKKIILTKSQGWGKINTFTLHADMEQTKHTCTQLLYM